MNERQDDGTLHRDVELDSTAGKRVSFQALIISLVQYLAATL